MDEDSRLGRLVVLGWSAEPWDMCWLECDDPGLRRVWTDPEGRERVIALCVPHAMVIESGAFGGDYDGAPLPAGTMCTRWPWRLTDSVDCGV